MKHSFVHYSAASFPPFRTVLKAWTEAVDRYNRQMVEDFAWMYHERASFGFLAAATWMAGGVALEEWREEKRLKGVARKGRCDLYLYRKPLDIFIEAKHLRLRLGPDASKNAQAVRRSLSAATTAAKELSCGRSQRRVGVVFVHPVVQSVHRPDAENRIDRFLDEMLELDHLAIAWTFSETLLAKRGRTDLHPGAIVIAR